MLSPSQPRREVTLERRKDGFWKFKGLLDDELGARTAAALEAYAKPRPVDEFGQADLRTKAERLGDAFADVVDLAIACPDQPGTNGYRRHHCDDRRKCDRPRRGTGPAVLAVIGRLTEVACPAEVVPVRTERVERSGNSAPCKLPEATRIHLRRLPDRASKKAARGARNGIHG